ncbi:hypothetical protein N665_0411s0006 [Sinapis alba]|nr:hypothetical protein N665_0411s0006 [Sinapis alba]
MRMTSSPKLVAKSKELGFVTSQLSGLRISHGPSSDISNRISLPFFPGRLQPIVAHNWRICPFTGKKANRANKVSFSNHKTKKLQFVYLQFKKFLALKTIEKNGLDAVAKKAGIDLRKK